MNERRICVVVSPWFILVGCERSFFLLRKTRVWLECRSFCTPTTPAEKPRVNFYVEPYWTQLFLSQISNFISWIDYPTLVKASHSYCSYQNPVSLLSKKMFLMQQLVNELCLHRVTVNYCAFGQEDKLSEEEQEDFNKLCQMPNNVVYIVWVRIEWLYYNIFVCMVRLG